MTGTVKFFGSRGYGFLLPDEGGRDVYVWQEHIEMDGYRSLEMGQRVEFDVEETERGPAARRVRVL